MNKSTKLVLGCVATLVAASLTSLPDQASAATIERNWALTGTASQSSTALGGAAARANDGNTDGNWTDGSVTHTNTDTDPYWEIDLGATHYVDEIRIYNRTDCCQERLANFLTFFVNNREGFTHRDLNSTMSQNTGDPVTAVYFKTTFFQAGDVDPVTGAKGARQTVKINGSDCGRDGSAGCLMRYVRIQIAGQGTLSLAEVEVIEKVNIPGPAVAAGTISWAPTNVIANLGGISLSSTGDQLLTFFRGHDKLLHGSADFEIGAAVGGSPQISADAPAAAWDSSRSKLYVAVRAVSNNLALVEGGNSAGVVTSPSWTTLGKTNTTPAVIVSCDRVVAAWLENGQIKSSWKPADATIGTGWSTPTIIASGIRTAPKLAADSAANVGMTFLGVDGSIYFTKAVCATSKVAWSTPIKLAGQSRGDQASIAAYGPHFIVAVLRSDNRGYIAIQNAAQVWGNFEQIPDGQLGGPSLPLAEAPRLFVMSGAIIVTARERSTKEPLYWIKFPNKLAPGDLWMGGRFVAAANAGASAPLMASLGQATLSGMWGAPRELYAVMPGAADGRVHAVNLGRFIAKDVLLMDLHLDVEGMIKIAPQPDRALDWTIAPNIFEQMIALLSLPQVDRDAVIGRKCGNSPLTLAAILELDRGPGTGQYQPECPVRVIEFTEQLAADSLVHEWLHADSLVRNMTGMSGFTGVFQFKGTGMDPAESGMKACTKSTDCGGDPCELAGDTHGDPSGNGSTQAFAVAETELRRWDNTFVCVAAGGPEGRRYQGGVRWYDLGTSDHAFIHMAIAYRWYGDDLRDWVQADLAHGNDQLQRRYNWVKTFFGGIEYNGRMDSGSSMPHSDRSLGFFGMPLK